MDFPILDLLDEQACRAFLVDAFHRQGLRRPGIRAGDNKNEFPGGLRMGGTRGREG